jgi:methylglutamate dehydrogenase subunit D
VAELAELIRRHDAGIATVMARRGIDEAHVAELFGVPAMPVADTITAASGETIVGTGPSMWLVVMPDAARDWADGLAFRLAGLASVSDQTGGYVQYLLCGPQARELLQKGAFIDLHPDSFRPGNAATTVIAHIGVILWQVDEAPSYHLALFRSFATSFESWFHDAAHTL